ncbi:hypothetical protein ACIPUD_11135 [Bradyrhizobium sp. CAR08]
MSQAQDLNNAVIALTSGFAALDTAVQAQLAAAAAANQSGDTALISQSIANIGAITSKMAADAAALTAAVPGATTVAPPATTTPVVDAKPDADLPSIDAPTITAPDATPPTA